MEYAKLKSYIVVQQAPQGLCSEVQNLFSVTYKEFDGQTVRLWPVISGQLKAPLVFRAKRRLRASLLKRE